MNGIRMKLKELLNDLRKIGTTNYGLMKNTEYQFTEEHLEIY